MIIAVIIFSFVLRKLSDCDIINLIIFMEE